MCHIILWILILIFTVLSVSTIDVKLSTTCEVKVELSHRMINVVNKDELCFCLKYEKATSLYKSSVPCKVNSLNSDGKLMISADSMCECAGYTKPLDVLYIATASTATDSIDEKYNKTDTSAFTHTTVDERVKPKEPSLESRATKVFNATHTAETEFSKPITTPDNVTFTDSLIIFDLRNLSKPLESSTTDKIEEITMTTSKPKSTELHFTSFDKVGTSDTTLLETPVVSHSLTEIPEMSGAFVPTNTTVVTEIILPIDIVWNSTRTTHSTERTTKLHPIKTDTTDRADNISTIFVTDTNLTILSDTLYSSNSTMADIVLPKETTKNTPRATNLSESTTITEKDYLTKIDKTAYTRTPTTMPIDIDVSVKSDSFVTTYSTESGIPHIGIVDNSTTTIDSIKSTTETKEEHLIKTENPTAIVTNKSDGFTFSTEKDKVSVKETTRNTAASTDFTESTIVTKEEPLYVKPFHVKSTIISYKTSEITSSTANLRYTTDKSLYFLSEGTNLTPNDDINTIPAIHSSMKDKLSSISAVPDSTESVSTILEKDHKESTLFMLPTEMKADSNDSDSTKIIVIPIETTRQDTDITYTDNKSGTSNTTNKFLVDTATEFVNTKSLNATDDVKNNNSATTDGEKADVVTSSSIESTPVSNNTNSGNVAIEVDDDIISTTNITLIIILIIILIVLLLLILWKLIIAKMYCCVRKGSYVLPHEADRNIEMDSKK